MDRKQFWRRRWSSDAFFFLPAKEFCFLQAKWGEKRNKNRLSDAFMFSTVKQRQDKRSAAGLIQFNHFVRITLSAFPER